MKKIIALAATCFCFCMPVFAADGKTSSNIHKNNCSRYGYIVTSNLYENSGKLERVEYIDGKVVIEKYGYDGEFVSSFKQIDPPLPIFGGFYSGEKYNYLVFGAYNQKEENSAEVIRLQKYSKSWEFLDECSVYGANTYAPFAAGSARMTEAKGKLYLYTSHTMYKAKDGQNHQSNMQVIVDIEDFSSPSNPYYPYTSHSFNQFIQTDGDNMYTVDHGDAYPREVVMSKYAAGTADYSVNRSTVLAIAGSLGDNETGVSIGGFELGKSNALIAGNTIVQNSSSFDPSSYRNIFIGIAPKNMNTPSIKLLTDYTASDSVTLNTPFLIKINETEFLVLWEEYKNSTYTTKIVKIDENGNVISNTENKAPLSMCEPVQTSDGVLHWYATDNCVPIFYWLDPNTYEAQKAVEEDWSYNAQTATLTIGGKGFMPSGTLPWAEYSPKVKNVVIKDGVFSISANAFSGCTMLESISIPDSVVSIGANAFKGCQALKSISLPSKVTSIEASTFEGCSSLKTVTVSGEITSIGTTAFYQCSSLESINIPNSMTSFGASAFEGCSALSAVNVPNGTASIPSNCFYDCSALKKIALPDSITSIGSHAFENCSALETVDMPKTLNSLGGGAFENCTSLKSIVVPTGVKYINGDTFRGDSALEKAVLPDTLIYIGMSSFYECGSLAEVNIPDSVQTIVAFAFYGCKMKEVHIPEGITSLNALVFAYCPIETVHIPSSVKTISQWAFGATRLKTVTVPEGVTSIGDLAFYSSSMRALKLPRSVTEFGDKTFDFFPIYNAFVYCHKGSTAESFAAEKDVKSKYLGDMDSDKELTETDAAAMLKYVDGSRSVSPTDYDTAALLDYDLDEKSTVLDAVKLLKEN